MAEIVQEKVTTQREGPVAAVTTETKQVATGTQTVSYLIYFLFGVLEIALAFRIILKLAGANAGSAFVSMIYGLTGLFILPFEGIFSKGFARGAETTSVFEPSAIVALLVYAVVAYGIVKLVEIVSREKQIM